MASPLFNFSGIASGLDTASIISSLMQVERAPITRMQIRRAEYDDKLDSWTAITTKVAEMRAAADAVTTTADFDSFVGATSSDPDAVAVTVTGSPAPASVQLTVTQLAATHQVATGSGYASRDDAVGAGTFSITTSAGTTDFTTDASTTLLELAQDINGADIGVNASIIQVSDTDHRLLLTADESGADGQFSVSSTIGGFATSDEISTGTDATIRLGDPVNGLDVTRSTNSFANVIDGVTLDLVKAGTGTITIDISRDTEAAATAITDFVNAVNGVLLEIDAQTEFNAESNTASPLTNDREARDIAQELRGLLGDAVAGGTFSHFGQLGVEFTREGTYSIDQDALRAALDTDYEAAVDFFVRSGTTDDARLTFVGATGETTPGTYQVDVSTAADVPVLTGSGYFPQASVQTFDVTFGATTATVSVSALASLADAIDEINAGLVAGGITEVVAADNGGAIELTAPGSYGSAYAITVTDDTAYGLNGTATGTDVAGTIGGEPATGQGRTLTASSGDPIGLSVLVTATPAEVGGGITVGNVSMTQGLMGNVDGFLDSVEGIDGAIARARGEWDARIENLDDSIAAFEQRMILREAQLRREFTAMESALAQLQGQATFLNGFAAPTTGES